MQRLYIFFLIIVFFTLCIGNARADFFYDDFESETLDNWTIGGRQAGYNIAEVVSRNGSLVAHLYHSSFTEIYMYRDFGYSPEDTYHFDLEVDTSEWGSGDFYSLSFVSFNFMDSTLTNLGGFLYGSASTSYPFIVWAANPSVFAHIVQENVMSHFDISVADMLSQISIDESKISGIRMYAYTYASASGPYTAQLWLDNVQHNLAPVPGAFLLGMLGLSVAGVKLRKHS